MTTYGLIVSTIGGGALHSSAVRFVVLGEKRRYDVAAMDCIAIIGEEMVVHHVYLVDWAICVVKLASIAHEHRVLDQGCDSGYLIIRVIRGRIPRRNLIAHRG